MSGAMLASPAASSAEARPCGIVAASGEEIAGVRKLLTGARRFRSRGFRFVRGKLHGSEIVAVCTGEGRSSAAEGARALLDGFPVTRLLVLGFGGGLSPALELGALFVARQVVADAARAPAPDAEATERLVRRGVARPALFLTSSRLLATAASKGAAWNALAQDGPAVVDLETAAIAEVAHARGVPYVALRAVSDTAEETLPVDLDRFIDARGRIRRLAILRRAVRQPSIVPGLWELRRRAGLCSEKLAAALAAWIEEDAR